MNSACALRYLSRPKSTEQK
uniref:Uncharacterized protein n=1 Tax=Arundo donax TaxID=35708 RepID=A0A0A9A074_ARUDO